MLSGGGRLDELLAFNRYTSGLSIPAIFYDAAVATSGGPFVLSGHIVLGIVPSVVSLVSGQLATPAASGVATSFGPNTGPVPIGMPFGSGLCVSLRSGSAPFTVTFSSESYFNF